MLENQARQTPKAGHQADVLCSTRKGVKKNALGFVKLLAIGRILCARNKYLHELEALSRGHELLRSRTHKESIPAPKPQLLLHAKAKRKCGLDLIRSVAWPAHNTREPKRRNTAQLLKITQRYARQMPQERSLGPDRAITPRPEPPNQAPSPV